PTFYISFISLYDILSLESALFPTRRSSDLGLLVYGEALGEVLLPRRYVTPAMAPGLDIDVFVYRDSEDRVVATTDEPHAVAGELDRKSTRLNSSHVKISYAVFCLKKKRRVH